MKNFVRFDLIVLVVYVCFLFDVSNLDSHKSCVMLSKIGSCGYS